MAGATCAAWARKSRANLFKHLLLSAAATGPPSIRSRCRLPAYINMTVATALNCETIRETFRAWNAERESLDSGLSESLAALEAYQLHLDDWQQHLARERKELQAAREQFDRDRSVSDKN